VGYNKGKSIDNLDDLFYEQFNYNPPVDWYDGLIFEKNADKTPVREILEVLGAVVSNCTNSMERTIATSAIPPPSSVKLPGAFQPATTMPQGFGKPAKYPNQPKPIN
jgi:hypothetical protein